MSIIIQIMRMYYRHNRTRPIPHDAPVEFDPTVRHPNPAIDYDALPAWTGGHYFALEPNFGN